MFSHNSPDVSEVNLRRFLKKDIIGKYEKTVSRSIDAGTTTSKKTAGLSCTDSSADLDTILIADAREVLNRAANEVSGHEGKIDAETLDMILEIFVHRISIIQRKISDLVPNDAFSCMYCFELLYDAVTLNCGHSFCRSCAKKQSHCKECKTEITEKTLPSSNIILASVLQKISPMDYVAQSLKAEADVFMEKKEYQEAILKYMDATEFGTKIPSALLGRAKAFLELGNKECALQDTLNVCTFSKNSLQAHLAKGDTLYTHGKHPVEALMCFLSCLTIDSTNQHALGRAKTILEDLLSKNLRSTPAGKKQKVDSDNNSRLSNDGSLLEIFLCCLLRDIDQSLLSDVKFEEYLKNEGKDKKVALSTPAKHDLNSVESSDLECSLCMMVFLNPVCTPCGHTFCRECLERSMDHGNCCPLCKRVMSLNVENQKMRAVALDMTTAGVIRQVLPEEYKERLEQQEQENKLLREWTPIFVCTLAFPFMPCPLHVFEPRYRLLMRRAIDCHDKKFGISIPDQQQPFQQYGTIVKIKNCSFFPDGRSVIESEGFRRFKTNEYAIKDGYNTAKVEYIVDEMVKDAGEKAILNRLSDLVYSSAKSWFDEIKPELKERIIKHFGNFPMKDENDGPDGPKWGWWVLAVIPVEDKVKQSILSKTQFKLRLITMHKILSILKKKNQQQSQ